MANIRVDLDRPVTTGLTVTFRSPADCSQVTGLVIHYPISATEDESIVFQFADAHGSNVGNIDHLFSADAIVKVVLDVENAKAYVQNADTNAYLEGRLGKLDAASGAVTYDGEYYDFVLGAPYFYFTKSTSNHMFLSKDCLGYIAIDSQKFYDRKTGEILSSFTTNLDSGNGSKYQADVEEDDLFFVSTSGGHCYSWVFNYKTGNYRMFSQSYDGYMTHIYYGGRRGNILYFYYENKSYGYYVHEVNVETLQDITTRSVTFQSISSYISDWVRDSGYLYRIGRGSSSKQMVFETLDLATGSNTIANVFTDEVADHNYINSSDVVWADIENKDIYFTYAFYLKSTSATGDRMFAKYNYGTNTLTNICAIGTNPYPNMYCGNIDDNTVLLKYSDNYLNAVDLKTGAVLRTTTATFSDSKKTGRGSPLSSSNYPYAGSAFKYTHKGKYMPFSNTRILNISTFEAQNLYYKQGTVTTTSSACITRYGDEYIVSASNSMGVSASWNYFRIYDAMKPPESRDSSRVVRRDT